MPDSLLLVRSECVEPQLFQKLISPDEILLQALRLVRLDTKTGQAVREKIYIA